MAPASTATPAVNFKDIFPGRNVPVVFTEGGAGDGAPAVVKTFQQVTVTNLLPVGKLCTCEMKTKVVLIVRYLQVNGQVKIAGKAIPNNVIFLKPAAVCRQFILQIKSIFF